MTERRGNRVPENLKLGGRWTRRGPDRTTLPEVLKEADGLKASYKEQITNLERIVNKGMRIKDGAEVPINLSDTALIHRTKQLYNLKDKLAELEKARGTALPHNSNT
jgi:hypothetical protein